MKEKISQERLKEALHYNPESGVFTWKIHSASRVPGDIAGTKLSEGYIGIGIDKTRDTAHRLAFLYMDGSIPDFVDHINGIRDDNRWCNLRPASPSQNTYNSKKGTNNKSGVKGVGWCKHKRKWRARMMVKGKDISIGYFPDLIGAELAVRKFRDDVHFEFSNHG